VPLAEGIKLGRYEIRAHIGTGGMGQVYLAQDTSELNRAVAIKLLPTEVAADPKWMQRFIREARTVSGLNHPNVLTIYEFGVHDSTRFMAMEYVDGVTLREHLNSNRLNLHEVLDIGIQVAAALNAAHEAHVIHRDIKPENIMLRHRDSIVKVLDFGLAKPVRQDGNPTTSSEMLHTETGIVMGTVSYMSPEQSLALKNIDYRTDIWSLGAVLYEMTAGRVPFDGKDLLQQLIAIQERPHTPLSKLVEHVPEPLERIIDKALAKNPDERYQTAADMLNDMRSLKRQLENQAENDRTALFQQPMLVRETATTQSGRYPVSSAEYIVNQVKLHKRGALILLGVFALAAFATLFWYFKHNRVAPLTDKDTILLAEFENKTGEAVFDDTLRQGLAVQLQQSPFLDIFPETRTRATLQLMSLSPDERVTRERAREICQRQGLKAFIAGTIVKFERNYSITLEALNGQTGDQLALVQVEAEGKDQVLKALSRAATELREKLGGAYSPNVSGGCGRLPRQEYSITVQFNSSPENVEKLSKSVFALIDSLKTHGPSASDVAKVKEQLIRAREVEIKQNAYWVGNILARDQAGEDVAGLLGPYDEMLKNITTAQIQAAAKKYFDVNNYARFVLLPENGKTTP